MAERPFRAIAESLARLGRVRAALLGLFLAALISVIVYRSWIDARGAHGRNCSRWR